MGVSRCKIQDSTICDKSQRKHLFGRDDFMKITRDSGLDRKNIGASCKKAPYQAPMLRVYGAVSQLTAGGLSKATDSTSMKKRFSDRALKQNIVHIGNHPAGFGLYLFDYKPELAPKAPAGRQFGVMADAVSYTHLTLPTSDLV